MPEASSSSIKGAYLREIDVTRGSGRLAVAQGVRPGEIVVVYPPASLVDGSKIGSH